MPHLLAVFLSLVGKHVDYQEAAARFEGSHGFSDGQLGIRHVMQNQHQDGDIELPIADGKRFQTSPAKVDIGHIPQT